MKWNVQKIWEKWTDLKTNLYKENIKLKKDICYEIMV